MEKQALSSRDNFEYWLANMDDALDFLLEQVPVSIKDKLDFSVNSLKVLESWVLEKYENTEKMLNSKETRLVNSIACYIGETFRKNLGGTWNIKLDDPKFAFFGLPIITGFPQESSPFCPLTLATTTADRRNGKFLKTILQNKMNKVASYK